MQPTSQPELIGLMNRVASACDWLGKVAPVLEFPLADGYALGLWTRSRELYRDAATLMADEGWQGLALITRTLVEDSGRLWELETAKQTRRLELELASFSRDIGRSMGIAEAFAGADSTFDSNPIKRGIEVERQRVLSAIARREFDRDARFLEPDDALRQRGWLVEVGAYRMLHAFVHGGDLAHRLLRQIDDDGTWRFFLRTESPTDHVAVAFGQSFALLASKSALASSNSVGVIFGVPPPAELVLLAGAVEQILSVSGNRS